MGLTVTLAEAEHDDRLVVTIHDHSNDLVYVSRRSYSSGYVSNNPAYVSNRAVGTMQTSSRTFLGVFLLLLALVLFT